MQVLACIQVLFITATTTKYAILDLILLNADTDVSTPRCLSLTSLFPISFSLSNLVGGLTLSLTNNTGSRVLTKRGTPDC